MGIKVRRRLAFRRGQRRVPRRWWRGAGVQGRPDKDSGVRQRQVCSNPVSTLNPRKPKPRLQIGSYACLRPIGTPAYEQCRLVDEAESVAIWIEAVERSLAPWTCLDRR